MTLRDEILALDPALLASRDDGAIAAAVNAVRPLKVGRVERAEFAMWCASNGMRAAIEDHAADKASPLRSIALTCRDVIQGATTCIDFSLDQNVQMLGAWITAGALSEIERDRLILLASRKEIVSVSEVSDVLNSEAA